MTRERFVVGTLAVAFGMTTMTVMSAWAGQDRPSNGNTVGTATPRGGDGGSSGSATPRGGDGGGSVGGSSSSSGGGDMGGSSLVGSSPRSTPSPWSSFDAPSRSNDQSARPRSGGSTTTGQATPRSGGGSSSPRGGGSTASAGDRSSSAAADEGAPSRRAVPAYSRPRDGRPVTGTATDRGSVIPPGGGNNVSVYPYYPWGFWGTGYGYGLGYLYYDPFWYGGYGFGYPYGYGGYGYGGYGYGGGGGYGVSQSYRDTGSLRLKISPRHAQVYIDGYYVGVVDSFDGVFQKLGLESGGHRVELKADGYEPLQFDALITPGETITYKGEMKRIQ